MERYTWTWVNWTEQELIQSGQLFTTLEDARYNAAQFIAETLQDILAPGSIGPSMWSVLEQAPQGDGVGRQYVWERTDCKMVVFQVAT